MKKYKQAMMSLAMITLIFTGGLCSGYNSADAAENENLKTRQTGLLNTFENKDFGAWKKLINKNAEISRIASKEDFDAFVEARAALRRGEYEKALGLSKGLENRLKSKIVFG